MNQASQCDNKRSYIFIIPYPAAHCYAAAPCIKGISCHLEVIIKKCISLKSLGSVSTLYYYTEGRRYTRNHLGHTIGITGVGRLNYIKPKLASTACAISNILPSSSLI